MTASKYIKSQGLPSLQYVADKVGKHRDTLHNWHRDNFALFEVVVSGIKWQNMTRDVEREFLEAVNKQGKSHD